MEEPGGLQSMGSQRVGHHWVTSLSLSFTVTLSAKFYVCVCACEGTRPQSLQSCPTLCNLMDCHPPSSSVPRILQARILEWVAVPSAREYSQPRDRSHISYVSCIAGRFFTIETLGKPTKFYRSNEMETQFQREQKEQWVIISQC